MKAIVRLDNNFEIDGFVVKSNDNETLFTWGNTPHEGCYCRTISLDRDEKKTLLVMSLIRKDAERRAIKDAPIEFMHHSISKEQNEVIHKAAEKGKCSAGYYIKNFLEKEDELEREIVAIINLFK